ncbi:S8 family serine peptidase [Catenulispora subtropica]|uniref:Peptidase S8/S53 domain-containing protein n=1 Tax=Catenulispora subtropica TaxID=450798 RepID=A0ABP5E1G4_9ACTN
MRPTLFARGRRLKALLVPAICLALMPATTLTARADTTPPSPPGWALARISQTAPLAPGQTSFSYSPTSHGAGVNAYVIDAGIDYNAPDLGGRAGLAFDVDGGDGQTCPAGTTVDEPAHGDEVADILGGTQFGVADQVNLWSVKAFHCNQNPTDSLAVNNGLIQAINWLAANHKPNAVAVIARNDNGAGYFYSPLYDPYNTIGLTNAVNNLAASGVFVAVSAGNISGSGAQCVFTVCVYPQKYAVDNVPANAGQAMVVMASDRNDHAALDTANNLCGPGQWSTALGGDIYAPGVDVPSAYGWECGTSDATPLVAGVAALYKATYGDAPSATVKSWISSHATQNAITNNPPEVNGNPQTASPNLLLNIGGL